MARLKENRSQDLRSCGSCGHAKLYHRHGCKVLECQCDEFEEQQ